MNQKVHSCLNNSWTRGFWNFISTDIGWLACIIGAASNLHWLGMVVVPILFVIHITVIERQRVRMVITTALVTMGIGFLTDTILILMGAVEPNRWLMPAPLTTLWDILIWANFSLTLDTSLRFLQKRPLSAAILGAVFAPGAYYAGDRLGALHFSEPVSRGLFWVGVLWFFVMPSLSTLARYCYHPVKTNSSTR